MASAPDALTPRYAAFWQWFAQHQHAFFRAVQAGERVAEDFFEPLTAALDRVKDGFYFQTGLVNEHTAELVLSAEGDVAHIVFAEELVHAAPALRGWQFTALKAATDIADITITMADHAFNTDTLSFYALDEAAYPDEISVAVVVHPPFAADEATTVTNGVLLFLDTYLGELRLATAVDQVRVIGAGEAQQPLVPIDKLQDFLTWREKEFVEKYEGLRHATDEDTYASFEAELASGNPLLAIMNTDLLAWDAKASHPWIVVVTVPYDGAERRGMPDQATYEQLNALEDALLAQLPESDGYLNVGRQTADGEREIYFACREFRRPAKVLYALQTRYANGWAMTYEIYKDKYWQSFERFGVQ